MHCASKLQMMSKKHKNILSNTRKKTMSEYKNTLNLPQTEFPMKADLAKREPAILEKWQALNLYQTLREQGKDQKSFVLHDGPPYANGPIHLGTAVNKVLKDMVVKSKTLSGFNASF